MVAGIFPLLRKWRWDLIALIAFGFVLPAALVILGQITLYNNFRQVFFILPPLFLIAGLGLDLILSLFRRPAIHFLIILLLVLPGLYATIKLYPYEYIYYNQLVGGLQGAYRTFELDYWNLGYQEAQSYINQTAGRNAKIYVDSSKALAQKFARADLLFNTLGRKKSDWVEYDYIIVSTAKNADQDFTMFPTVFVVKRDGVPLMYVKKQNN